MGLDSVPMLPSACSVTSDSVHRGQGGGRVLLWVAGNKACSSAENLKSNDISN